MGAPVAPRRATQQRATAVFALKFMSAGSELPLTEHHVEPFLKLLTDPELVVRRNALLALNSIAHNRPYLVGPFLVGATTAAYLSRPVL